MVGNQLPSQAYFLSKDLRLREKHVYSCPTGNWYQDGLRTQACECPVCFSSISLLSEEIRDGREPREKTELRFPLRLPDNGIWGLGGCHIPLTHLPPAQKANLPLSKGRGVRGRRVFFIIPLCSSHLTPTPPRPNQLHRPCLPKYQ